LVVEREESVAVWMAKKRKEKKRGGKRAYLNMGGQCEEVRQRSGLD